MKKSINGLASYDRKAHTGFTIVELLIVIVVIAILAAISVVAYTGIQNRANDTVVQSDVSNTAKKIQVIYAGTGAYPVGGYTVASSGGATTGHVSYAPTPLFDVKVSRAGYHEGTGSGSANYMYCTGPGLVSGTPEIVVSGQSKSLKIFQYSTSKGLQALGTTTLSEALGCDGIGYPRSYSWGYFVNSGGWQSWTQ